LLLKIIELSIINNIKLKKMPKLTPAQIKAGIKTGKSIIKLITPTPAKKVVAKTIVKKVAAKKAPDLFSQLNKAGKLKMPAKAKVPVKAAAPKVPVKKVVTPKKVVAKTVTPKKAAPKKSSTELAIRSKGAVAVINKANLAKKAKTSTDLATIPKINLDAFPQAKKKSNLFKNIMQGLGLTGAVGTAAYFENKKSKEKAKKVADNKKKVADNKKKVVAKKPAIAIVPIVKKIEKEPIKKVEQKVEKVAPKKAAPTVSQLWKEKTGTSWSEAKKQGLTDGSLKANLELMAKLKSGNYKPEPKSEPKVEEPKMETKSSADISAEMAKEILFRLKQKGMNKGGSGMGAMEKADAEDMLQGYKKGGATKRKMKMKKGKC
jgi:hypothetical protein